MTLEDVDELCGCGYRQSLHHVDSREGGVYCHLARLRHAAAEAPHPPDLAQYLRDSLLSRNLFGIHDEPLDSYGCRIVRVILSRLEASALPEAGSRPPNDDLSDILADVHFEVHRARRKHPSFPSDRHGESVIREELEELWEEIREQKPDPLNLEKEAVHVAATAIRFIADRRLRKLAVADAGTPAPPEQAT